MNKIILTSDSHLERGVYNSSFPISIKSYLSNIQILTIVSYIHAFSFLLIKQVGGRAGLLKKVIILLRVANDLSISNSLTFY